MSTRVRVSPAYGGSVQSPFLDDELFVGESEEQWEPQEKLATESPFQNALEEGPGRIDPPEMEEPESFDEELYSETEAGVGGDDDQPGAESPSDEEEHFEHDVPKLSSAGRDHPLREIADGQRGQLPEDILAAILSSGETDAKDLTNRVFWKKYPALSGTVLDPKDQTTKLRDLRKEWGRTLSRHVKPIIWLRQLIDELEAHRGSIPVDFLLGWMAAESDGKVSTVSTLGERGYFQIMWQGGEAKAQLGLTRNQFLRLSTDRRFSIQKGIQLAETYRQHFLKKYPAVPDNSDLLWRLTKGRHALPSALDKALDALVKAGTPITWQEVSKSLPKMTARVDHTFDYAAKLKPLVDRVAAPPAAPPAATPELYAESEDAIFGSAYEDRELEADAEQATEEDLAEFDPEKTWDGETPVDEEDQEILWTEIAELLPPRVFQSESDEELVAHETPPWPEGVRPFEHWFQPMKEDKATNSWIPDGDEKKLEPINPGFFDASGELERSSLEDSLRDLLTGNAAFSRYLSRNALRDRKAQAGDRIRVALVDLTGSKLLDPEFAGWGASVAVDGASCPKVAALYAAFQLRHDLKHVAAAEKIATTAELIRVMTERWKKEGIEGPPVLEKFLYPGTNPPALEFTAGVDEAVDNIIHPEKANHAAKVLIDAVGFPYIASLMWHSGLRHPTRGGLWLTSSYASGARWRRPSRPPPPPVFGHNATALSLATFFTLLAQDRLVRSGLPRTIKSALTQASWFRVTLPSASIASKVGLLLKCLRREPKMKDGQPVLAGGKPVQECKESEATHVHEAGLIENGRFRYAVAIMTTGIPAGVSVLEKLIGELDGLIRKNNP